MSRIILIETSTSLCSTALAEDGKIICYKESGTPRSQASLTAPFIKEMLDLKGISVRDCDAVCVSAGPGSYTGLRVGVSTAKGLCFSAGVPLLSVGTLEILAAQAIADGLLPEGCNTVIPMIDARRMEVYTAVFKADGEGALVRTGEVEPRIIDADSFKEELSSGPVLFIGDGALKCKDVLNSPNAFFAQACPRADAMLKPALEEFEAGNFRDTAYFEPFYLKDFVATVSRKKLW